ncbi:phosphoribosylaminoimidazolesuccinocarboxamide synthase [bacterium]|nr:MAG: phosphoribosylaminoimidazolesuccinocarboxamide synthase [bacterium]
MENLDFNNCITRTNCAGFSVYRGKVRDVYTINEQKLAIVASDRISAFDHILKEAIPYKGQILNSLAAYFFEHVKDIVPIHILDIPHPNITIGKKCTPIEIEVVIRGYLTGHAWRTYKSGLRELCGVKLPEGLKENERFTSPILTPATKAKEGHDEDISEVDLLERGIVAPEIWEQVRSYAFKLFERGSKLAEERGLLLVDTKYEFGLYNGEVTLIDEVHTADSSRYFYKDDYEHTFPKGEKPKQLSKEFVREWLMDNGFQGKDGQVLPSMPESFREEVYTRYKSLYETLTGKKFTPVSTKDFDITLENVLKQQTGDNF